MSTVTDAVKEKLYNNHDLVVSILEDLGCHQINKRGDDEIRCARPDGDNRSCISIKFTKTIKCNVYTQQDKFGKYEYDDIVSLVMYLKKWNFTNSVAYLCKMADIQFDGEFKESKRLSILKDVKQEIRLNTYQELPKINRDIIKPAELYKYKKCVVNDWIKEGITEEIQKKFGIMDDVYNMRWLIPIRDEFGNIINLKGRTYAPNADLLKISKYIYYRKLKYNDILFGYHITKNSIEQHKEVILYEGEKSVMKSICYGYDWCTATSTNVINDFLLYKIKRMNVENVVIAYDKDVSFRQMKTEAKKLSRLFNVYIIYDRKGLLGNAELKNAPVDCGKEIFEELYDKKEIIW